MSCLVAAHFSVGDATAGTFAAATVAVPGDPIDFTTPIEASNLFDRRDDKGTIEEVCFAYGRTDEDVRQALLLPGTQAASAYMRTIFTWAGRGTLGQCRELLLSKTNRNCDGQIYPAPGPGAELPLHFYSDCWSNHAQGRASDFLVGKGSGRQRIAHGTAMIEWLLAPDAAGNKAARARRLGVQEIIFFDRCWDTSKDSELGATTYLDLRECDVGHYDHVHLSFTVAGALGLTTGYGASAPPAVKPRK
ncbi:MAG: hypothetical protein K8R99_15525 [Actinomycetia bacterium]|nr:hypothetical protein [Actinomycetes bacterium]